MSNECEKGAPIVDLETCKAMGEKYLRFAGELYAPHIPSGCIMYTNEVSMYGFYFIHDGGGENANGYRKVCKISGTVTPQYITHV